MLLLSTVDESIDLVTSTAVGLDYTASWVDLTTSGVAAGSGDGAISSATTTTLVAAPGASTARQLKGCTIKNTADAVGSFNDVVVRKVNSGSYREMVSMTLGPNESLHYSDTEGWIKFDANGNRQCAVVTMAPVPAWNVAPGFSTANLTSTKTLTSGTIYARYMGKAPRALPEVRARLRVTTAAATITWAEAAIAKGSISVGTNPSLTVVGYLDVSAIINSTGQKTLTIPVSSGQTISAGEDVWLVIGNSATTAGVVRAQSIADDLQVGWQASVAQRPSLILGSAVTFTIEGATTLAPWLAIGF